MNSPQDKLAGIRMVQARIREILLDDWDPIGVGKAPQAQDEYDSYVGPVYTLIEERRGSYPIAQYLYRVQTDRMGLTQSKNEIQLEPLAQKLAALADEL